MAGEWEFRNLAEFRQFRESVVPGLKAAELRTVGQTLKVAGQKAVGFEASTDKMFAALDALAAAGPKAAVKGVNYVATKWLREIVRHCPVDTGLLRQSFQMRPASMSEAAAGVIEASVGTNVPYAVFLEYGTRFIAGGAVASWAPGDAPILDWAAKRGDANGSTVVSIDPDGTGRTPKGKPASAKATSGAEFMPPMRGSWYQIEQQMISELQELLVRETKSP